MKITKTKIISRKQKSQKSWWKNNNYDDKENNDKKENNENDAIEKNETMTMAMLALMATLFSASIIDRHHFFIHTASFCM